MSTHWDSTTGFSEGWGIFLASLSEGGEELQLCKLDDPAALGYKFVPLPSDEAAWRLVLQRASYGSALHQRTLDLLREESPSEWERINSWRRT